ncbi:MAG TPA: hypothetical protein VF434_09775, partial [Promineifilum sp.]
MTKDSPDSEMTTPVSESNEFVIAQPKAELASHVEPLPLYRRISWSKIGLFFVSLFLFLLALTLMKDGARGLAPLFANDRFALETAANTMG